LWRFVTFILVFGLWLHPRGRSARIGIHEEATMAFDERGAIDHFWDARRRDEYFPADWYNRLNIEQAYRVQLGVVARRVAAGEQQVGWKIGMTSEAMQCQFGFHEPVFGCLMAGGLQQSGHMFATGELIRPGFESEVSVRLREPLSGHVGTAEARHSIAVCFPALEVIETRGDLVAQMALALADNAQQKAFVLGEPVSLTDHLRLAEVEASVAINGAEVARALGAVVLGDPLNSVVWLAGRLAEFGLKLRAGDLIMTGSFTRQFPLTPGDRVRAEFRGMGSVEVSVATEQGGG
jgi:2-keto-4-pentenoate hydratase